MLKVTVQEEGRRVELREGEKGRGWKVVGNGKGKWKGKECRVKGTWMGKGIGKGVGKGFGR